MKAVRETGFQLLDFSFAMNKAKGDTWYSRSDMMVAELEIDAIRKDGRILAHSLHGRSLFLGISIDEEYPLIFYKIVK